MYSKNPWNKHNLCRKFKVFNVMKGGTSVYHYALKGIRNSLKKKMDRRFLQGSASLIMPKQNNDKEPMFSNETRKNLAGRFTVTHTTNKPASQSCQYSTIWQIKEWRNLNKVKFINWRLSSHSKLLLRIFYKRKKLRSLLQPFRVRYDIKKLSKQWYAKSEFTRSSAVISKQVITSINRVHARVPGLFIKGAGLSIFSLVDLRFFCPSKCIHTLTSEWE